MPVSFAIISPIQVVLREIDAQQGLLFQSGPGTNLPEEQEGEPVDFVVRTE